MKQTKVIVALTLLPFLITAIERYVITPAISTFPIPETSVGLIKYGAITLLILSLATFRGNNYGLEISKKLRNILGIMFLALIVISYFFLFSIKYKGFFDSLIVIHLVNWMVTVFREEFILRGVIQTESGRVLKGSFLKVPNSIWFTSIIFSIWHLVNLSVWPWQTVVLQMISCIPSGIILGLIKEKTGNTLFTYLLHICGDLLFFSIYLLLFSKFFFTLF